MLAVLSLLFINCKNITNTLYNQHPRTSNSFGFQLPNPLHSCGHRKYALKRVQALGAVCERRTND